MGKLVLQEPVQQQSRWTTGHLLVMHRCRCPRRPIREIVVRRVAFRREMDTTGLGRGTAYAGLGH